MHQRFTKHSRSGGNYRGAFIASFIINICLVVLFIILLTTPGLIIPPVADDVSPTDVIDVVAQEYSGEESEQELGGEEADELPEKTEQSEETAEADDQSASTTTKKNNSATTAKTTTTTQATTTTTTRATGDNDGDFNDFF